MSSRNSKKSSTRKGAGKKSSRSKGDLKITVRAAPTNKGRIVRTAKRPEIRSSRSGVRVRHSEYFTDVALSSTAFQLLNGGLGFAINPGNEDIFPWLSPVAMRYETYKFHALRFRVETTAATTTNGAVYAAVDYDANDHPPNTKQSMLAYAGAVRGPVWTPFSLDCPVKDLHKIPIRNCLDTLPPSGQDIRLYNVGNLFVAAEGVDVALVGELWVDYDVELETPQMSIAQEVTDVAIVAGSNGATGSFEALPGIAGATRSSRPAVEPIASIGGVNNLLRFNKSGHYVYNSSYSTAAGTATTAADIFTALDTRSVATPETPISSLGTIAGTLAKTGLNIVVSQAPSVFQILLGGLNASTVSGALGRLKFVRTDL